MLEEQLMKRIGGKDGAAVPPAKAEEVHSSINPAKAAKTGKNMKDETDKTADASTVRRLGTAVETGSGIAVVSVFQQELLDLMKLLGADTKNDGLIGPADLAFVYIDTKEKPGLNFNSLRGRVCFNLKRLEAQGLVKRHEGGKYSLVDQSGPQVQD